MKKILMITICFRPNIGGVESHLNDLCEYLRKRGYFVYVLTYQPITTKLRAQGLEKTKNLEIHRFWWPGYNLFHKLEPYQILEFLYLAPYLFFRSFLFMVFNQRKIDVIHAHGLSAAFGAKFLASIFKKRAIMSTYSIYNFNPKSLFSKIVRWTLSSFDQIQALANPSKRELLRIGLEKEKLRVYYLWVNPADFKYIKKEEAKKIVGLSDKFMVLFVGRLIRIKGPKMMMGVAKQLPKINFVFVGDGPLAGELEEESRNYSNIIFAGKVDKEKLNQYYHAADIFVLPSLYEEAFGKVAIEALSTGTPVIGSNRGAIPDIVSLNVGRVIKPTPQNFKNEIEFFFRNQGKLGELSENCQRYARKNFSERNARVIEGGYEE